IRDRNVTGVQTCALPIFEENYTHVLRQKLDQGELDAIIVALPFSGGGLVRAQMYEESFSVLLPANHPWKEQEAIRPEQLLDETRSEERRVGRRSRRRCSG